MKNTPIAEVADEIFARAQQTLLDLCAISSESGNAEGIRHVAERLENELTRLGLHVEILEEHDAHGVLQPLLLARGASAGKPHLLLLGHMDTVLPAVEPRVEGRLLFGTGSLDMKGGLAMLIGALELLVSRGRPLPSDLLVVLVPDEEAESVISGEAAKRWSREARAVLVLEPGLATADGETLVAGRRGLTEWTLEVRGRASHSGVAYWRGRSALAAAADWCNRAQFLSRPGAGPTINVARMVGGSSQFVDDLRGSHTMLGGSRHRNVVPDRAVAEGEIRYLSERDGRRTIAELERLAEEIASRHEVDLTFKAGTKVAPVDPHGAGAPLVRQAVELAAERGFILRVEEDRGGVSFPNFIADPATTPVIDGLGPTGDGMHVRSEHLDLDSLDRRIVLLADLLSIL